ncbi:VTT domain-containing protein [Clostridium folliculivorans]|uniref:VTT domain-containing protein n=1 Tax=Clostridium folliculivorans TaxID=2886038 RepID=A0A9W5Y1P3_9CLOT|nr:VTT domain-containing protein [Clostridium folliculivorans]GKU24882.1 hypothetical protein CFOLD11_17080 [Clostridium folliculivorans]GKU30980.1 hypothetical protein CFB3_30870 [Clostridium folliculivorans]
MQFIMNLFNSYSYAILLISLTLELIAFPLPGEIMMTYCGFLIYESKLNLFLSVLSATLGVILGITISYLIGSKFGIEFINKYFSYFHINKKNLEKPSNWFNSYGNNLLLFSYFIPGVRHITGYFSGITKISYKKFAINAYLGALIWTFTFISLGMFLGPNWEKLDSYISKYMSYIFLILLMVIGIIYSYKNHGFKLAKFSYKILNNTFIYVYSFAKNRNVISILTLALIGIFALIVGIVQDYITSDLNQFNLVATYYIKDIFSNSLSKFITILTFLTSNIFIVILILIIAMLIIRKSSSPRLELQFLFTTIVGGEMLCISLNTIFKRLNPITNYYSNMDYTFPSHEGLMSIVAYGFSTFIVLKYVKKHLSATILIALTLLICLLSGISPILSNMENPSAIYNGYVFGLVWLTINLVLLDIYIIINNNPKLSNS